LLHKNLDGLKKDTMESLKSALDRLKNKYIMNIDGGDEAPPPPLTKSDIKNALEPISERNRIFLWITVGLLLIIFVGSVLVIYRYIDKPSTLTTIFSITGVSIFGLIVYMTYLWRQIVGINFAIAVADRLDSKDLYSIISGLLSTLGKSSNLS
jgi:multisubunit Na+/H+ antiporter MnhF subunit